MDGNGDESSDEGSVVDGASIASDDRDDLPTSFAAISGMESNIMPLLNGNGTAMDANSNEMAALEVVADSPVASDVTDEGELVSLAMAQYYLLRDHWMSRHTHATFDNVMRLAAGNQREAAICAYLSNGMLHATEDHGNIVTKRDKKEFARTVGCALERGFSQFFEANVDMDRLFKWGGDKRPMLPGATEENTFAMHVVKHGLSNAIQIFMVWELHNSVQTLPQQSEPGRPVRLNKCLAYGAQFFTSMGGTMLKYSLERNQFHTYIKLDDPPTYASV